MEKVKYDYFVVVKKIYLSIFFVLLYMKNNEANKYKYVSLSKKVFSRLCPKYY